MAIQFGDGVTRNVTPIKSVTRAVTVPVTRDKSVTIAVTRDEFNALKAEVAVLRELIARQSVEPSTNKRAAYMREYRKLHPKS